MFQTLDALFKALKIYLMHDSIFNQCKLIYETNVVLASV